jgi:hypothetical protein
MFRSKNILTAGSCTGSHTDGADRRHLTLISRFPLLSTENRWSLFTATGGVPLVQLIVGRGAPYTLHVNTVDWPSTTFESRGVVVKLGAVAASSTEFAFTENPIKVRTFTCQYI